MSTLSDLCASGVLVSFDPRLDEDQFPQRAIYMYVHVSDQISSLAGLPSTMGSQHQPEDQLDELFYSFCIGEEFSSPDQFHVMKHKDPGVWELKTTDLRVFGWFYARDVFICTDVKDATFVKHGPPGRTVSVNLYEGFCARVIYMRTKLDLNPPKFVDGKHPENVLSNYVER